MKYIEVEVRTASLIHGYDQNNKEIAENIDEQEFVKKLVSIDRIQSISEQFLLVKASHERIMYWEYRGSLQELKSKLESAGLLIT